MTVNNKNTNSISLKKVNKSEEELQILWAEVYIPDVPDAHNDTMTAEEIRKMAYDFMINMRNDQVDVQHDNKLYGCFVVENFIARESDDMFIEGSWVVAIWVPDKDLWGKIKDGELNGLSMEVLARRSPSEMDFNFPALYQGQTDEVDGHTHKYEVYFDKDGTLVGGKTDTHIDENGKSHYHVIKGGTITETAEDHHHRYAIIDAIVEL